MQAAQRSTASDLPKPAPGLPVPYPKPAAPPNYESGYESVPESAPELATAGNAAPSRASALLSPITLPIAAARRYLERQRGEGAAVPVAQGEGRGRGQGLREPGPRDQEGGAQQGRRQDERVAYPRSQDRRLERSLYEGYAGGRSAVESIEAGLDFDPGPEPDPEAVRGAISRLARAVQPEPAGGAGAAGAAVAARAEAADGTEKGWAAARARLTPGVPTRDLQHHTAAATGPGAVGPVAVGPDAIGPDVEAPLPFAEVARRLWGSGTGSESLPTGTGTGTGTAVPAPTGSVPAPTGPAPAPVALSGRAGKPGPAIATRSQGPGDAAGSPEPFAGAGPVAGGTDHVTRAGAGACDADDAPALAHDACNLLSALGLYGELLAFPGVLGPRDRHYAEELKLLAARSEVLIGRLLRVGEAESTTVPETVLETIPETVPETTPETTPETIPETIRETVAVASPETAEVARHPLASTPAFDSTSPVGVVSNGRGDARGAQAEARPQTSLVDLLMRWGSLLSTLAHGTLEVAFGPGAATPVSAGAEPIERILVNLVRNARAATVAGGSIRITVGVRALEGTGASTGARPEASTGANGAENAQENRGGRQFVVLTVDDSGCGMSAEQLGRILGTSSGLPAAGDHAAAGTAVDSAAGGVLETKVPGRRRGLGLQIVRELVAASGGELSAESRLGVGTRIEIRWPTRGVEVGTGVPPSAAHGAGYAGPSARTLLAPEAVPADEGQRPEEDQRPEIHAPEVLARETLPREVAKAAAHPATAHLVERPDPKPVASPAAGSVSRPADESAAGLAGDPAAEPEVAMETVAGVRPWPRSPRVAGPSSARAAEVAAAPPERTAVGPDGFTEEQLRMMMLRLHRSAPGERPGERRSGQGGERPGERFGDRLGERVGERIRAGTGYRSGASAGLAPAGHAGAFRTAPLETGPTGPDAARDAAWDGGRSTEVDSFRDAGRATFRDAAEVDSQGQGRNRNAGEESALKGAIAC